MKKRIETKSRLYDLQVTHKPCKDENNHLKNGSEVVYFNNRFGYESIGVILRWKNGFLHSENGVPAVEMQDMHCEWWNNGYLSREEMDGAGNLKPAVISDGGETYEFWVEGERLNP